MKRFSELIKLDGEYTKYISTLKSQLICDVPYPIAVNGLSGGAEGAFLAESVIEARLNCGAPVLIFAESEQAREKIYKTLLLYYRLTCDSNFALLQKQVLKVLILMVYEYMTNQKF